MGTDGCTDRSTQGSDGHGAGPALCGCSAHTSCGLLSGSLGFIWDLGSIRKRNCRAAQSVRGPNTTAAPGVQAPHSQGELSWLQKAGLEQPVGY